MKFDFKIQSDEINLAKLMDDEMNKKPKKVYMFIGTLKESGFNILEESIIDSKAKLTMFIGVDKKNTTKALLDSILQYTKEIYVYNNNDLKEFESSTYIFEFEKTASIYLASSNTSESGITSDISVFSRVVYNLENESEKKDYKNNIKLLTDLKKFEFTKLDKELIQKLIDDKVIFSTKQYEHNIRSISEFLGKKDIKKTNKTKTEDIRLEEDIRANDFNIPIIDLSDSDIEIDIPDEVMEESNNVQIEEAVEKEKKQIEKENKKEELEIVEHEDESQEDEDLFEGPIDLNDMLLTKSKVKLNTEKTKKVETENEDEETVIFKKLDLNNVSNYIFELPGKQQNGQDLDVLKIPNYIKDLIPNFFEFSDNAKSEVINGSHYKVRDIQVEIVDVKNVSKVFDANAKMMQKKGQTYMTITSKKLEDVEYSENDIARIIKLSSNLYHIEIVSKEMQEYKIWSKIMNKKLKGVDRKYGIM